jgi:hypothetical protein
VPSKRIQCDEIWSFVYAKAKNVPTEKMGEFGVGDVWTFTAIDADSNRPYLSLRTERDNRVTPAMASRLAKSPWTLEQVVGLLR